jgi:hypothetical protein
VLCSDSELGRRTCRQATHSAWAARAVRDRAAAASWKPCCHVTCRRSSGASTHLNRDGLVEVGPRQLLNLLRPSNGCTMKHTLNPSTSREPAMEALRQRRGSARHNNTRARSPGSHTRGLRVHSLRPGGVLTRHECWHGRHGTDLGHGGAEEQGLVLGRQVVHHRLDLLHVEFDANTDKLLFRVRLGRARSPYARATAHERVCLAAAVPRSRRGGPLTATRPAAVHTAVQYESAVRRYGSSRTCGSKPMSSIRSASSSTWSSEAKQL